MGYTKEKYIIVCDESTKKGKKYSYFFGGAILKESEYEKTNRIFKLFLEQTNLGEAKRTKITQLNYKSYIDLMDLFFTHIKANKIRARVMLTNNNDLERIPSSLDETYCKFYYLFIRHAFSLFHARKDIQIRLALDDLPETKTSCKKLKDHLVNNLQKVEFAGCNKVILKAKDIEEVDSKKHPILQCVDVLIGLVDFAMNSSAEERSSKRGKAKWQVWKFIESKIREIHPNIILDTTTWPIYSNKGWKDPYKHFVYTRKKIKPLLLLLTVRATRSPSDTPEVTIYSMQIREKYSQLQEYFTIFFFICQ